MRFARHVFPLSATAAAAVGLYVATFSLEQQPPSMMLIDTPFQPCRYPLCFAHGWGGFEASKYFRGVFDYLEERGCVVVGTKVAPFASIEARGQSLADQIRLYCAEASADAGAPVKVNVIAHSMGGLDIRYAVSKLGLNDCVASVTTVSSPHRGSALALWPSSALNAILDPLLEYGVDLRGVSQLTPAFLENFNASVPDHPEVAYFSVAGASDVKRLHPLFLVQLVLRKLSSSPQGSMPLNDGVVPVSSAIHGTFLGVVPQMDHFAQCVLADPVTHRVYGTIATTLSHHGF